MLNRFLRVASSHVPLQSRLFSPKFSEIAQFQNNFLSTTNLVYIESLYEKWLEDKSSVSPSFAAYFEQLQKGGDPESSFVLPPKEGQIIESDANISSSTFVTQQLKIRMLKERYRAVGHQFAKVDPLGLDRKGLVGSVARKVLDLDAFGFNEAEKSLKFPIKTKHSENAKSQIFTVEDYKNYFEKVYCGPVGYEYTHLLDKVQRDFMKRKVEEQIESLNVNQPSKQQKIKAFDRLCKDQSFIDFMSTKFATLKRFGIEGLNTATMALQQIVQESAKHGAQNLVLGMAHRGRLNTLHCVFDKPAQQIFKQFLQKSSATSHGWDSGDVKYHLGHITTKKIGDQQITLNLLPNPSHLQTVNPLVYGSVRAKMEAYNDLNGQKNIGVIVHGDAAIAGQGIVYESCEMQDLKDYTPKGIIHVVMNNQIGFTTNPQQARSSYYCTEIAKVIGAPVIHVNANEPAILTRCIKIAVAYRFKFKKDIFIDIVGYRRYGHNEQDQPAFTQPHMYEKIKNMKTTYELFAEQLIAKGIMTGEQVKAKRDFYMKKYDQEYQKVINDKFDKGVYTKDKLNFFMPIDKNVRGTGVSKTVLDQVFTKLTTWPDNFSIHPTIKKIYEERIKNYQNGEPLDWATMESLAFATLLKQGYGVRLSGQDVERGTFSHRHAYISDQNRDVPKFCFLKQISPRVTICNSHLSEYGVLGFEYGYTITNPNVLTIWEAQFGDFSNGASIMIDNYIVAAQPKWGIQSGIVMNLPHGMDGQGPQHSSARIQRYLHMSDDNCDVDQSLSYEEQMEKCNIQVVVPSSSANYFHAMRRQMVREYRKPLIMFNSKKLLKFKGANRPVSDIIEGTEFMPVYPEEDISSKDVKRVLICNGQFYYQLKSKRDALGIKDTAIVRIEQIAPFPVNQLKQAFKDYGEDVQYCWVQQEHENYGAGNFLYPRLKMLLKNKPIKFYGRPAAASPANGRLKGHKQQQQHLLKLIFDSPN